MQKLADRVLGNHTLEVAEHRLVRGACAQSHGDGQGRSHNGQHCGKHHRDVAGEFHHREERGQRRVQHGSHSGTHADNDVQGQLRAVLRHEQSDCNPYQAAGAAADQQARPYYAHRQPEADGHGGSQQLCRQQRAQREWEHVSLQQPLQAVVTHAHDLRQ